MTHANSAFELNTEFTMFPASQLIVSTVYRKRENMQRIFPSVLVLIGLINNSGTALAGEREPLTLSNLAIDVHDATRSYMLSDKHGGFLVGELGQIGAQTSDHWSVNGGDVVQGLVIRIGDTELSPSKFSFGRIFPHQIQRSFQDGTSETIAVLDPDANKEDTHAILVQIQTNGSTSIALTVVPGGSLVWKQSTPERKTARWSGRIKNSLLTMFAGQAGTIVSGGLSVRNTKSASFLVVFQPEIRQEVNLSPLYAQVEAIKQVRIRRMERLLNTSYLTTSDVKLDRALQWVRLSLDALIVESPASRNAQSHTFAVAGLPWDGSINCRENAIAIHGLDLALGEYKSGMTILRSLSMYQDRVPNSHTYGRIAEKVHGGTSTYAAADVTPWFVRQMYEHVVWTNDTSLVRVMAPVVKRSIEGTLKYHVDSLNLLTHGDGETWMNVLVGGKPSVRRGNRAVELQLLWYFQQLIGGFVATFTGDPKSADNLSQRAAQTESSFTRLFIDSTQENVYDHVTVAGVGVSDPRPNALFCLELVGSERVAQNMIKTIVNTMVYPWGVGSLGRRDERFTPYAELHKAHSVEEALYNGPVWTWLAGQLTYALTRYDRQDFTFKITTQLVHQILDRDMAGTLPAAFEAQPRPGELEPRAAGLRASVTGMAEFIRSFYEDYLGIRVDASSNLISLEPKLPEELTKVDFTVYSGAHPINGQYMCGGSPSRIILHAPDLLEPMKLRFLWMMKSGNAWKVSTVLRPNVRSTFVIGEDDIVAYEAERATELKSKQKLKGFSRRSQFAGIDFVKP
jgi:glycogen debranching enzyme